MFKGIDRSKLAKDAVVSLSVFNLGALMGFHAAEITNTNPLIGAVLAVNGLMLTVLLATKFSSKKEKQGQAAG